MARIDGWGWEVSSREGGRRRELNTFELLSSLVLAQLRQTTITVMSAPGSPSSSRSSSPPLELDPATLAILGSFLSEKADEERRFQELAQSEAGQSAP